MSAPRRDRLPTTHLARDHGRPACLLGSSLRGVEIWIDDKTKEGWQFGREMRPLYLFASSGTSMLGGAPFCVLRRFDTVFAKVFGVREEVVARSV